jgi:hypothetical protein
MSRRQRVAFQGTPTWHERPATRDAVDLDPPPPDAEPNAPEIPRRRRRVPVAAAAVGGAAVLAVVALTLFGSDPGPDPERSAPAEEPRFDAPSGEPRVFITAAEVLGPPLRGTVNRYWAADGDDEVLRAHVITLGPVDDVGPGRAAAVLVVDATRRAKVLPGDGAARIGGVDVRVMTDDEGSIVLEWDLDGWGLSLTSVGLDLDVALAVVAAVTAPAGDSLLSGRPPVVDRVDLEAAGLTVTDQRAAPASISGGPLVGQAGLDSVEAYVYRTVPEEPAGFVVTGSLSPTLRARDLGNTLGPEVHVDTVWEREGPAVGLELSTATPVAFRVTGTTRMIFDHPSGVTFWVASDQLSLRELAVAASAVDFERIALRLTRT